MKGFFNKASKIGGGGFKCPCCAPHGGKYAARAKQILKQRAKRYEEKLIQQLNKGEDE